MPQAAPSSGQPRPISRLGRAGRPYIGPILDTGTLPLVLQALLRIGDAPDSLAGYGLLLGLLGLLPLLLFWSFTAMDFNLRKNDGHGSSYLLDWAKARELLPRYHANPMVSSRFWERHLGSDALCTMWLMSFVATLMECGVLLLCWVAPSAKLRFLLADGLLLVLAMWLMLSAAYPENFNTFALFPKTKLAVGAWLGKKLKCCVRLEKPHPLRERERRGAFDTPRAISRGNSGVLPRVLQRQNSNSRVWIRSPVTV